MQKVIVAIIVLFIIWVVLKQMGKLQISSREHYEDIFYAKDYAKDNFVSRPTFRADLSPRFDAYRMGGGQIVGDFPGMSVQAAPVTPVESLVDMSGGDNTSYANMGGAYDQRLPQGGLTTNQVNEILQNKFGRNAQSYIDPKALLPAPDMKKALARDPSDPGTYMYDRYLYAPMKRRYGDVPVDFIRGDLAIPQLRMGWFDAAPVANRDLVQGYMQDYVDIQQSTQLKDILYERKPSPVAQDIPYANLAQETVYSIL